MIWRQWHRRARKQLKGLCRRFVPVGRVLHRWVCPLSIIEVCSVLGAAKVLQMVTGNSRKVDVQLKDGWRSTQGRLTVNSRKVGGQLKEGVDGQLKEGVDGQLKEG